ncbi:MAG: hypothetical protein J6Z03_08830 [Erysipelotrichaceae bacterium]|nr:hypothetical protein [Erysipelotrichaceae bacterium]
MKELLKRFKEWDDKNSNNAIWQFVKFNLVSWSISILQLLLANLLPYIFDSVTAKLPPFLRPIFDAKVLFEGESKYVVDGVVTWGYVLPFFLSNFIANIYGYFANMKATFKGEGSRKSITIYIVVLISLILFSTWLQCQVTSLLSATKLAPLARTIAAMAAGMVQYIVIFPLEKFVLFKEKK